MVLEKGNLKYGGEEVVLEFWLAKCTKNIYSDFVLMPKNQIKRDKAVALSLYNH
jgi:hypothetical protein